MSKRNRTIEICSVCELPIKGPKDSITCVGHTQLRTGSREIKTVEYGPVRDRLHAIQAEHGKLSARDLM